VIAILMMSVRMLIIHLQTRHGVGRMAHMVPGRLNRKNQKFEWSYQLSPIKPAGSIDKSVSYRKVFISV